MSKSVRVTGCFIGWRKDREAPRILKRQGYPPRRHRVDHQNDGVGVKGPLTRRRRSLPKEPYYEDGERGCVRLTVCSETWDSEDRPGLACRPGRSVPVEREIGRVGRMRRTSVGVLEAHKSWEYTYLVYQ